MSGVTAASRDLKKLLGNPKIIFVLGGPASGKGTQCEKIVEEFGFTHISTGDLMRQEISKGTKEGEQVKKIVAAGGLVPFELTVQILINALIATPSKTYLVDGFPRAIDQAIYFEKQVTEVHSILFYDVPQEIMLQRCMKRAETSGRSDDNAETIKVRVQNYFDQSLPVVNYYKQFGKVHHINALASIADVYSQTKKALMPQCFFLLGQKASGKTTVGLAMAERTNMKLVDFDQFILENGLIGQDDDTITSQFIQYLSREKKPRLVLENFPKNHNQAKYFLRNGTVPSLVISLLCSRDMCQERMIELGQDHPKYIPSSILSKLIKKYNDESALLVPFFQKQAKTIDVNTDQPFDKTMEYIYNNIEPTVVHIRPGGDSENLQTEIINKLSSENEYINLDIQTCIKGESHRGTSLGIEFQKLIAGSKVIPAKLIVQMLNKIIYCGQEKLNKYILTNFPEMIEQSNEFERNCSKITAMIYPTSNSAIVEIKNNNLSQFNIDTLFQKQFKLKTMNEWSFQLFNEKLGNKTQYGIMVGKSLSGKSTLSEVFKDKLNYKIIDMKKIQVEIKKKMGTDEEPFEGEVPITSVEKEILNIISQNKSKSRFIFDDYIHKTEQGFLEFLGQIGLPDFVLFLQADQNTIKQRFLKKNEVEEIGEEQLESIKLDAANTNAKVESLKTYFEQFQARVNIVYQNTEQSLETVIKEITSKFSPKVILVNHEKNLPVDTTCANLAIKYNMVYISAYQTIKSHILSKTEWGKQLQKVEKKRQLDHSIHVKDEFQEVDYSPVHYDLSVVMQLIKETINEKRTNQKFVLIEGLCNSMKLQSEDDQMEIRLMDEFFCIESIIGEVAAVIGLQYELQPEMDYQSNIEYEKFPEPVVTVVEKTKPAEGEEEEEQQPAAAEEDEGEKKAPKFQPEKYQWTISNRRPKNLPKLFNGCKGFNTVNDPKKMEDFDQNPQKAISRCLDEFCSKLQDVDNSDKYLYQQVVFPKNV